jgi:hypothetical protein
MNIRPYPRDQQVSHFDLMQGQQEVNEYTWHEKSKHT